MTIENLYLSAIRIDGGTQARVALDEATIETYTLAMDREEEFPPIVVFYDGVEHWLADGFHRYFAARKRNLESFLCDVRTGTRRDAVLYAVGANATHGKPRSNEDKRAAVKVLLEDDEWSQWSDNSIASACRVSHPFVGKLRRSLTYNVSSEDTDQGTTAEPVQRSYTTRHGTVATMNVAEIGKAPKLQQMQVKEEYYTPQSLLESVRCVMDGIDLDPTSCAEANELVMASCYYTREQNALEQDWHEHGPCSVWCPLPYTRPLMGQLVDKLFNFINESHTFEEACLICNTTDTSARWFQRLLVNSDAVCFPRQRVAFVLPGGAINDNNRYAQAIFYIGEDLAAFANEFSLWGEVVAL